MKFSFLIFLFCLQLLTPVFGRERVLPAKNEYFGETVEIVAPYTNMNKHVYKTLFYYDQKRTLIREEVFLTEFFSGEKGYYKMVFYYNSRRERIRKVLYYLDFPEKRDFFKKIFYLNPAGKVERTVIVNHHGEEVTQ